MHLWTGYLHRPPWTNFIFFSSSDRAVDIYSKMLSKQKKGDRGPRMEQIELKRQEEQAEMERLRQIRQQEQNELQIKAEVERRVQNEVSHQRSYRVKPTLARHWPLHCSVLQCKNLDPFLYTGVP